MEIPVEVDKPEAAEIGEDGGTSLGKDAEESPDSGLESGGGRSLWAFFIESFR